MNATQYTAILEKGLLPFIAAKFLHKVGVDGSIHTTHRFSKTMIPKHTSRFAQQYCSTLKLTTLIGGGHPLKALTSTQLMSGAL